jgi:hypothetical protein
MKNLVTAVWTGFGRRLSRLAVMRLTLLGLVLALAVGVLVATVGSGNGRLRSGTDPGRLSNRALANEIYLQQGYSIKTAVECFDVSGVYRGTAYNRVCGVTGGTEDTLHVYVSGPDWKIVDQPHA